MQYFASVEEVLNYSLEYVHASEKKRIPHCSIVLQFTRTKLFYFMGTEFQELQPD